MDPSHKPPNIFTFDEEADKGDGVQNYHSSNEVEKSVDHGRSGANVAVSTAVNKLDQAKMVTDEFEEPFISVDAENVQSMSTERQALRNLDDDNMDTSDNESLFTDYHTVATEVSPSPLEMEEDMPPSVQTGLDLAVSINGLYRMLDLINEQGTGGLVDKIIIAQDSIREFVNAICPGAYVSMTKVNFKSLDQYVVKPIGVYGSKQEIVKFLLSIGSVDDAMAEDLLCSTDKPGLLRPRLHSGLYVLRHLRRPGDEELFVIYWPEDTTWDDSASANICRNRETFMRYLTKMCDQILALISPEHASSMVWNSGGDEYMVEDEDVDGYSRLVTFEVAKTNEQEESVGTRPGFHASSEFIATPNVLGDCPFDPPQFKPWLLHGETTQGFMTLKYQPATTTSETLRKAAYTPPRLRDLLKDVGLQLSESLDARGLEILLESGLQRRFPSDCCKYVDNVAALKNASALRMRQEISDINQRIQGDRGIISKVMHDKVARAILRLFPTLVPEEIGLVQEGEDASANSVSSDLSNLFALFPEIRTRTEEEIRKLEKNITIESPEFKQCKKRICFIDGLWNQVQDWDEARREELMTIAFNPDLQAAKKELKSTFKTDGDGGMKWLVNQAKSLLTTSDHSLIDSMIKKAEQSPFYGDAEFVANLDNILARLPRLGELVTETKRALNEKIKNIISGRRDKLTHAALRVQEEECAAQAKREAGNREEVEQCDLRASFAREISALSQKHSSSPRVLIVSSIEDAPRSIYSSSASQCFILSGVLKSKKDPLLQYTIHIMDLDRHDRQELQVNPSMIPSPRFHLRHIFHLEPGYVIARAQLLEGEKIFLAVTDRQGNLHIYYESLTAIDGALSRGIGKPLDGGKIGQKFLLAFDESKRMLCVVATSKLQLHLLIYDDGRKTMQARGTIISLSQWYQEGVYPCHACFICGSEELLLVDSQAHARVFSLVTLQFRPAVLDLKQIPVAVYSSPDASCLLTSHQTTSGLHLTAYHWSTFGTTEGIPLEAPQLQLQAEDSLSLTSLANKSAVHLVKLDVAGHKCDSVALDITRKVTEFMFKEKGARTSKTNATGVTAHNSLIDCHAEVWARFPVVSAVGREAITSESRRKSRSIVFVTDRDHDRYAHHFFDLITTFERTTKKPGGDTLKKIKIAGSRFSVALEALRGDSEWDVTQFLAGEWIVDFLCLIPIHIAITKENRFVPLKDGVYSTDLEKSLLGADVNRIVDALSFGWYESIFQSYMATKPVKVVSSMGEQSVGKSFALNHLADTSFAGSAMRTTEGVWMSVTPTEGALIVALDFEGVHSIERSAQEDTLLVLFNTAISNLVLFRNNFALSRDITGLFQSFQSSSTVLDPGENPSLFNSTLMIIIKASHDVVDSDTREIIREFQLKFQRIVQDEQGSNFITRLHRGQLDMLPWPVIESKEFYRQFSVIKKRLDRQKVTYGAAGEFLHLMKTLMAKLKANDWGALSQTMASHRAQLLLSLLPNALAYGLQEVEDDGEPLRNLDTDITIDIPDTGYCFFLAAGQAQDALREHTLSVLRETWEQGPLRQQMPDPEWVEGLSQHLETIVNMRIDHVREWLTTNMSRFQAGHASIEDLGRTFESATVDLKSNVTLCKLQCASCQLLCVKSRFHQGQHECQTDHFCIHECDFCLENSGEYKSCKMSAGHPGKHICMVDAHLCGQPCNRLGKSGCLEKCIKVMDHPDGDHECAATIHACGEPCDLNDVRLGNGTVYSCPGKCHIASDLEHEQHRCDARLCSVYCQLCKRLCAETDHLHGLQPGATHLCGQPHSCESVCSVRGICEIETAPHSIEATFTGRHETFQYTKFSQVSKRLKCVKVIPPGEQQHTGAHTHSLNPKVVHFCEVRCEYCGYFCTLPLGHAQQEHETRHGSMSHTRWAIDGPEDASLEIEGRRFSSNDEGAPMMCNLVCQAMGRHAHISYCRAQDPVACTGDDQIFHIHKRLLPNADDPKDFITHSLYWQRSGFKDPYSREEQTNFTKCDAMCSGPEHSAVAGNAAQPSYCMLPIFHAPRNPAGPPPGMGYVSHDGHVFSCRNPVVMQQAFHVIFVADKSGSMACPDRRPLPDTPASERIIRQSDNRFGAVLSSLYSFWLARDAAMNASGTGVRRDAYSVILFDSTVTQAVQNDLRSNADELLDVVLRYRPAGGTNFTSAIRTAQDVMQRAWSTERTPVIIFLSDGECHIPDPIVQDLCMSATQLGKAISFHAVSFGRDTHSSTLRRMSQIALAAQQRAPRDPLLPAEAMVQSSYSEALDSVQLAETFLGIAESLRKPRGSLMS
ncbi:hypothetical protein HYDPIDRAFT_40028 [Hydnomerulius pinastri MD-312]|uniref:VWFA domain-containing protein n=1 Tax=Hydnomerulius pinastri MD-312 TaxID=994086 RepID=A0A0C9W1P4_9AGAM|nr:hypothetical protein HYDPIDRAFT_40028 [Hydnomerulius pinastri MD-312]